MPTTPACRPAALEVRPATEQTWADLQELLGRKGSVNGCWCMFFRQTPAERKQLWGEGNRRALHRLVASDARPGLIGYRDGRPAGWVSVAPRADYPRLDRSPVSKRVDDRPVWSLACLYVGREHRGGGVARGLVRAALRHARDTGAELVEAYPVDDALGPVPDAQAYHGWVSLLTAEGFTEVARRQPRRPVMRHDLTGIPA
ncbi:MAG TPA: GNAT family N-acetyltransferase [Mycobacteriales bacterium]|nr:GNAT family N-acetyltransferase [Mycobacteriales bacterium]